MRSLSDWLHAQGLGEYLPAFERERITLDQLAELSDQDLRDIGVTALGDRKRLLRAMAQMQASADDGSAPLAASAQSAPQVAPPQALPGPQRRQVTVMFCDLVGSTSLSTRLDPEDFRELMGQYHQQVSREVKAAGGFVAKFMGDGVLAYFGYPQASENDAERAVRAGLALAQGLPGLQPGGALQVRVGIATGLVVVGDLVVEGTAPERAVVGETPNLAARLQALAEPGQVLISASTRRLIGELFEHADGGIHSVKGFAEPVQVWRVVRDRAAASRFEAQRAGDLSRFVGRDTEVAMLMDRWRLALDGEGQVVLITGEAGIGKSRITAALGHKLSDEAMPGQPAPLKMVWQCSPLYSGTALYPVVQQLQAAQMGRSDSDAARAAGGGPLQQVLQDAGLPEATLAWVLRLAGTQATEHRPAGPDASADKANTLYALLESLEALAQRQPVLLLLEDAHWIDPTTEELLTLCVQQLRTHRVMLVVTARPGYAPEWRTAPHLTQLVMNRLSQRQCMDLAQQVARGLMGRVRGDADKPWVPPPELLQEIVQRTDGVPLFVEELTKAVLEAGAFAATGAAATAPAQLAIPSTLQDSLTARLDRLQAQTREVAQAASVIGRDFEEAVLCQVLLPMPAQQVGAALDELQRAELVYRSSRGQAMGSFKHALVRDAAYASLLKGPRAQWHAKVASALTHLKPELAAQQPELLGSHHQQAGDLRTALDLWTRAGDLAFSRSALTEAADHYRAAIALCPQVSADGPTVFHLQMRRASALTQAHGYGAPEGLEAARRAMALTTQPELAAHRMDAACVLGSVLVAMGSGSEAERLFGELAHETLPPPRPGTEPARLYILGTAAQLAGRLAQARGYLLESIDHIEHSGNALEGQLLSGMHPKSWVLSFLARNMMYAGLLDQGRTRAEQMMETARHSQHAPTLAWAMIERINWLHMMDRSAEADELNREVLALAERYRVKPQMGAARMYLGRALLASGQTTEGAAMMRSGMDLWTEGLSSHITIMVTGPARAMAALGDLDAVNDYLEIGERALRETDERLGEAELLRMRAWLARKARDGDGARALLLRAIQVAQQHGAGYFELRAAMDLAKFTEGGEHAAHAMAELQRVYGTLTEGFGFPAVMAARTMLTKHD